MAVLVWFWPICITLIGTVIVSLLLSYAEIETIIKNWDTRRCDVPIMFTSFLYKPSYDTRSATQFASDNFNFCIGKMATDVGRVGFAPFFAILGQQFGIFQTVSPMMNNMRGMLASRWKQFSEMMNEKYKIYGHIMIQFSRIFQRFRFAMGRTNAIGLTLVYLGLSLNKLIMNTIKTSVRVVLIVCAILAALCIILFFVMAPLIPSIILPVIVAITISAGIIDASIQPPDTGPFCCDPHARVKLADGTYKPLHEIHRGDRLASTTGSENRVEGILYVDSAGISLVSVGGVIMSGSHRVLNQETGEWVLAKDHPDCLPPPDGTICERLICLNTTAHEVPLEGILVSDWEEVSDHEGQNAWIDFVASQLDTMITTYPTSVPLASKEVSVFDMKQNEWKSIQSVQLGDRIRAGISETRVIGIYYGIGNCKYGLSDGVWISSDKGWSLYTTEDTNTQHGTFLITEAEEFTVQYKSHEYTVRDFTECGASRIADSYTMLSTHMKKTPLC